MKNPFKSIVDMVNSRTPSKSVRKSDMPEGGEMPPMENTDMASDMTQKVVMAFTDGSLEPTPEAVTQYLIDNGMSEEEAGDTANMILDSYFEASNSDVPENTEMDEDVDMETMKSDFANLHRDIKKSNFANEVIAQGIESLMKEVEFLKNSISLITEDNKIMKSALRVAAGNPKSSATPVFKSVNSTNSKTDNLSIEDKRELILTEVKKGNLVINELTYLNQNKEFSQTATNYFKKSGALK